MKYSCHSLQGVVLGLIFLATSLYAGEEVILDSFSYASRTTALSAWTPMNGAPNPQAVQGSSWRLRLPCPMPSVTSRIYWDRPCQLNLDRFTSFSFDLECDRPEAIRLVALYLKSGAGWYVANQPLVQRGHTRMMLSKSDFSAEGQPAGWQHIETIRIALWKGADTPAMVAPLQLTASRDEVFLLQADGKDLTRLERDRAVRATRRISRWLGEMYIGHQVLSESAWAQQPPAAAVVILPYNPRLSTAGLDALKSAGKLMVFDGQQAELARLMQVRLDPARTSQEVGRWNAFRFSGSPPAPCPGSVYQHAWTMRPVHPADKEGRVLACWENARGQVSHDPAVLETARGFWIGSSLLDGDRENKKGMLLYMLGRLYPPVWKAAADYARINSDRMGQATSLEESIRGIETDAGKSNTGHRVAPLLQKTTQLHQQLQQQIQQRAYQGAALTGLQISRSLARAFAMAQSPEPSEMRGAWDHNGVGLYPGGWDAAVRLLKENGFNTLFANMLWTGKAHYPSNVVPPSKTLKHYGDQLEACVAACGKYGIDLHVWKVCWKLEGAAESLIVQMRKQDRLQVNAGGTTLPWLCPSQPQNRDYEIKAMVEAATRYPVQGIHLDYVRYPDRQSCYCASTRHAFEKWIGRGVRVWPRDVLPGGALALKYEVFRSEEITGFVRETRKALKAAAPRVILSAAVWGSYPDCIASRGQNWAVWLQQDLVDFVTPMNYTNDPYQFSQWVRLQQGLPGARGKIVPGIGVIASESELSTNQVIEQILITRHLDTPGFAVFKFDATFANRMLPALGAGITRPQPSH